MRQLPPPGSTTAASPARPLLWADLLKVLAVFGVILIHSAAPLLVLYRERGAFLWWTGNLYDSAVRWCIPVFFMLSGMFLLPKSDLTGAGGFLLRRLRRIGLPFVMWSVVYLLWSKHTWRLETPYHTLFLGIFVRPAYYHLWFLYVLMGLYLLAPLFGEYLRVARPRSIAGTMVLWFVFGSLLPTIQPWLPRRMGFTNAPPYELVKYAGFFVLGYLMRGVRVFGAGKLVLGGVFLAGYAVTAGGTYLVTVVTNKGVFDALFYEYYSPNVLAMATAVFIMLNSIVPQHNADDPVGRNGLIGFLAGCVPGVYLIHALLISALKRGTMGFVLDQDLIHPLVGVPLLAVIVFGASLAAVAAIRGVPVLRRIVP